MDNPENKTKAFNCQDGGLKRSDRIFTTPQMKCRSCHYDYDHDHDHDDPDNHDQLSPSPVENCGAIGEGGGGAVAGIT